MSDSIYAPPQAEVAVPQGEGPRYYVVSPKKFLLLYILTFGMYALYWFYRNWRSIKESEGSDLWPVPRAIFAIFFTHSLLRDVDENIQAQEKTYDWQPMIVATLFVIIVVLQSIGGQFMDFITDPSTMLIWLLALNFLSPVILGVLLLQGQKAINFASNDEGGTANARITAANWAWMIFGAILWLGNLFTLYVLIATPEMF